MVVDKTQHNRPELDYLDKLKTLQRLLELQVVDCLETLKTILEVACSEEVVFKIMQQNPQLDFLELQLKIWEHLKIKEYCRVNNLRETTLNKQYSSNITT